MSWQLRDKLIKQHKPPGLSVRAYNALADAINPERRDLCRVDLEPTKDDLIAKIREINTTGKLPRNYGYGSHLDACRWAEMKVMRPRVSGDRIQIMRMGLIKAGRIIAKLKNVEADEWLDEFSDFVE